MAGIASMNWVRRPSAVQQAQRWRERHAIATERDLAAGDAFVNGFIKAHGDRVEGLTKLVVVAAIKRVEAEAKAKSDAFSGLKLSGLFDRSV